eukprot:gene16802-18498_t
MCETGSMLLQGGWIFVVLITLTHVSTDQSEASIKKCRVVGDDTVVCTIQRREPPIGSFDDDDDDDHTSVHEAKLSERTSRLGFRRKDLKRNPPGCVFAGSSIHCQGGIKISGRGAVGRTGSPGLPGPKGEKGGRGSPGRPGQDGEQGPRGFLGEKGEQGAKGQQGERGDPGRSGQQGMPGIPSNCNMLSYKPTNCPKGNRGPRGLKGSEGEEGPIGAKGRKGRRGAKGETGPRGASGVPGSIGLYGALMHDGSCRQLFSPWVFPSGSPIGQLKTQCQFREYLLSLEIEPHGYNGKIRYNYKCCPFKASDIDRMTLL